MSATKLKLKELIFECETEKEALQLLKSYRKKNFHLVSKKIVDPKDATIALKLIKFRQPSSATSLETVWENFVTQMTDLGVKNSFISTVLKTIRSKENFWETHPHDHLRDILMDSRNFIKVDQLAKVIVLVAPKELALNFFAAYQSSLSSMIDALGVFVMVPKSLKSDVLSEKTSAKVQVLSYDQDAEFSKYQKDIDMKVGLVLVTPEDINFIKQSAFADNIKDEKISLVVSSLVDPETYKDSSYKKHLAFSYDSENASQDLFNSFDIILNQKMKLAFLWDHIEQGSILNAEAQVLKILDDTFENETTQHLSN